MNLLAKCIYTLKMWTIEKRRKQSIEMQTNLSFTMHIALHTTIYWSGRFVLCYALSLQMVENLDATVDGRLYTSIVQPSDAQWNDISAYCEAPLHTAHIMLDAVRRFWEFVEAIFIPLSGNAYVSIDDGQK